MAKTYRCSGPCGLEKPRGDFHEWSEAGRLREVTSRCRECRSEDYFTKRYKTVCAQCMRHRPLDKNEVCARCNAESGLKQCHGPCGALLSLYLGFDANRKTCKHCRRQLRRS